MGGLLAALSGGIEGYQRRADELKDQAAEDRRLQMALEQHRSAMMMNKLQAGLLEAQLRDYPEDKRIQREYEKTRQEATALDVQKGLLDIELDKRFGADERQGKIDLLKAQIATEGAQAGAYGRSNRDTYGNSVSTGATYSPEQIKMAEEIVRDYEKLASQDTPNPTEIALLESNKGLYEHAAKIVREVQSGALGFTPPPAPEEKADAEQASTPSLTEPSGIEKGIRFLATGTTKRPDSLDAAEQKRKASLSINKPLQGSFLSNLVQGKPVPGAIRQGNGSLFGEVVPDNKFTGQVPRSVFPTSPVLPGPSAEGIAALVNSKPEYAAEATRLLAGQGPVDNEVPDSVLGYIGKQLFSGTPFGGRSVVPVKKPNTKAKPKRKPKAE